MCHITCSCSPGKLTPVFVLKLCSWRKALVWSENYVLLVCCLGDFPVISEKLNVLETQMRSLQTARKNQLAGQGCGKQKLHTYALKHNHRNPRTHTSLEVNFAVGKIIVYGETTTKLPSGLWSPVLKPLCLVLCYPHVAFFVLFLSQW